MVVGRQYTVEAVGLQPGAKPPAIAGSGSINSVVIPTACEVSATLKGGDDFRIEPINDALQGFQGTDTLTWSWWVWPEQAGNLDLKLVITPENSVGPGPSTAYPFTIQVKATPASLTGWLHQVTHGITESVIVGGVITGLVTVIGTMIFQRRKERRDGHPTERTKRRGIRWRRGKHAPRARVSETTDGEGRQRALKTSAKGVE